MARLNLLDRAIAAVNPRVGVQRAKARMQLELAGQAGALITDENMGGRDRPLADVTGALYARSASPNDEWETQTDFRRSASRLLIRNDPIAAGAINANGAHVIGTGLTLQAQVDFAQARISEEASRNWNVTTSARFLAWATSPECDVAGRLDFYDQQYLSFVSMLASGDTFALLTKPVAGPFTLALQLIEADRVGNPFNEADVEGERIKGVELGAGGRPTAYHVCSGYPDSPGTKTWRRIPARGAQTQRRNVVHLFEQKRPGQVRGVPYLAGVVRQLDQMNRYSEAELHAAVTAAALTVFTKMDADAFETFTEDSKSAYVQRGADWDGRVRPGTAINLLPGEDVMVPENKRPNANFDPFFMSMVRQIGVGLEIPVEVLMKHFESSYSAARASLMDAWRTFRRRRDWMAKKFCQPIYEEWLADEIAAGNLSAPGFFNDPIIRWAYSQASWIGDGPGSIDPEKEVRAARERIDAGISTLQQESILHDGGNWEAKHAQRIVETTARREAKLEAELPEPPKPGAPPPPVDQ